MKYRGREIDPVRLWENYVDFPANLQIDGHFLPKVQCPNPNHDTTKRHFQINIARGLVHCFAYCGISGNFEHALCVVHGLYEKYKVEDATDERERKRRLQRARKDARKIILRAASSGALGSSPARRDTQSEPITTVPDLAYATFVPQLGLEYLEGRGITSESISFWKMGWDVEERRIVIPAEDQNGHVRFLIKRAVREQDWPKYLYTEGFPKTSLLFGACQIDPGMVRSHGLVLVEGSFSVIWLRQQGISTAGAILGTGISVDQSRIVARLRPPRIYLMFDKDSAGIKNISIAARRLRKYPLFVVRYPKGKEQPTDLTRREVHRALERAMPISKFFARYPNVRPQREVA